MRNFTAIRTRGILHGSKGEGRIMGEWQTFDDMHSRAAIEAVCGIAEGGQYREVATSSDDLWFDHGYQRITYATADGLQLATVYVLRIDRHGPVPA